jgi:hypothetical protein
VVGLPGPPFAQSKFISVKANFPGFACRPRDPAKALAFFVNHLDRQLDFLAGSWLAAARLRPSNAINHDFPYCAPCAVVLLIL